MYKSMRVDVANRLSLKTAMQHAINAERSITPCVRTQLDFKLTLVRENGWVDMMAVSPSIAVAKISKKGDGVANSN